MLSAFRSFLFFPWFSLISSLSFVSFFPSFACFLSFFLFLKDRYITTRFLPDKAIDLMDEACAIARVQVDSKPEVLDVLERQKFQLGKKGSGG